MLPTPPLPPGHSVGPYILLSHLARGGFSDVYAAVPSASPASAPVALKLLAPLAPADAHRAERETTLAAALHHPHIVTLLDHGSAPPDARYLALELLRGETLADRLARGPLAPADAITLGLQLTSALSAAHALDIVHRDLKPANIFLCADAATPLHAKVLDFGVARRTSALSSTTPGTLVGTPAYMPPEQVRGDRDLDARADLWSLGATLYECLSGRLPFEADTTLATLFRVAFDPPPRLDTLRPELPPALCAAIHRALEKDRAARFPDAAAFADALAAVPLSTTATTIVTTPTSPSSTAAPSAPAEVRLVTAVFARGARDLHLARRLADELDACFTALPDGAALAAFGLDRWTGDEPRRALSLARSLSLTCDHVGVATGRTVPAPGDLTGSVADAASTACALPGLGLDATTADLLRGVAPLTSRADDSFTLTLTFAAPASASTVDAHPLIGRATDLALLLDAVDLAVTSRRPAAALVLAPVGLGKSHLLLAALATLTAHHPAARTLRVSGDPSLREAPLAALHAAVVTVDPLLAESLAPGFGARDPQSVVDRARAALDAVLRGLSREGPVVVAVDDAHWLDGASRALLRSVCDGADDVPVALWIAAEPDARTSLEDLVPGCTVRSLPPLSRDDAARLVATLLGHAPAQLVERGDGNPLFLESLARLARDGASDPDLPASVEAAQRVLLDRLGAAEKDFLKRAAVFGRRAWIEGVTSLGATPAPFEGLRRRGVLSSRSPSRLPARAELEFRSASLADVAHGLWPAAERAGLHCRAADWLSDEYGATPDEVARHHDEGGDPERAAEAWTRAAEHAAHAGALDAVCAHAARVLDRTERPELRWRALTARDTASQLAGDRALQREGLTQLEALAETMGPSARAEVQWRWCHHARMVDDVALAERTGLAAAQLSPTGSRWGSAATMELALLHADRGRVTEALDEATRAMTSAAGGDDPWLRARATHTLAYVLLEEGADFDRALRLYRDAAAGYQRTGDHRREAIALLNGGAALAQVGRFGEALDAFDEARTLALRVGNARTAAVSLENRGAVRRALGELDAADEDLALASVEARRLGHRRLAEAASIERLYVALSKGEAEGALRERWDEVAAVAGEAVAPAQAASAVAAALRGGARLGLDVTALVSRARGMLGALGTQPMLGAELLVALWLVDGRREDDRAALDAALGAYAASAANEADRRVRRLGFVRRFGGGDGFNFSSCYEWSES